MTNLTATTLETILARAAERGLLERRHGIYALSPGPVRSYDEQAGEPRDDLEQPILDVLSERGPTHVQVLQLLLPPIDSFYPTLLRLTACGEVERMGRDRPGVYRLPGDDRAVNNLEITEVSL